MEIIYTFLGAVGVMFVSLAGVISLSKTIERLIHRSLHFLPSLAAGIFLLLIFNLALESREIVSSDILFFVLFICGFLILTLIAYSIPDTQKTHAHESCTTQKAGYGHAKRMLFADGIHNISDGIILAVAFSVDIRLGCGVLFGVLVHEFVQELSEYFVLIEAGYTRKKALTQNFLVSGTILIGVLIGISLESMGKYIEGALLAVAAGAFFFVVVRDLIPHSLSRGKKDFVGHIASFMIGIFLMLGISIALPHSHEHGNEHSEHNKEHLEDEHSEEYRHEDLLE